MVFLDLGFRVYIRYGRIIWVVVKIMVPFWVLNMLRHLKFRAPQKGTRILTTTHIDPKRLKLICTTTV